MLLYKATQHLKILLSLLCTILISYMPLEARNYQRIHPSDGAAYQYISSLYLEQGLGLPSSSGPWSAAELISMLEKLDREALSDAGASTYNTVFSRIISPRTLSPAPTEASIQDTGDMWFSLFPSISFEGYGDIRHFSGDASAMDMYDSVYGFYDRRPAASMGAEAEFGSHVYAVYDHAAKKQGNIDGLLSYAQEKDTWSASVDTNLHNFISFENRAPFHALMAWGDQHSSFTAGRGNVSWGDGETGNLLIGDHGLFYDYLSYSVFGYPVGYSFFSSQFDRQNSDGTAARINFGDPVQVFTAHRFEITLWDSLRIAISEGALFSADHIDFRMFSPLVFLHSFNNFGQTNNIVSLEFSAGIAPGLAVYGQAAVDQLQLISEGAHGKTPNAYGLMAGIKGVSPYRGGYFRAYAEQVYTSPYLYLRDEENTLLTTTESSYYSLDLIVAHDLHTLGESVQFLGYEYGPDAVVSAFGFGYDRPYQWSAEASLLFMLHGTNGMLSRGRDPSLDEGEEAWRSISPTGIPQITFIAGIEGSRHSKKYPWLELYGSVYGMQVLNDHSSNPVAVSADDSADDSANDSTGDSTDDGFPAEADAGEVLQTILQGPRHLSFQISLGVTISLGFEGHTAADQSLL